MGNGSPQYRWRLNSQSRSRNVVVASPRPLPSSHAVIVALASGTSMPLSETSSLAELMVAPSPVHAPPSNPSGGCTVRTTGSPKASANAQSRSSSAGTAMIAPVP